MPTERSQRVEGIASRWPSRAGSALFVCAIAGVLAVPLVGVRAQSETAARKPGLEEIVVTAQKRAQNVQDVPISITAMSADLLRAKGLTNVAEVGELSPNVDIDTTSPFSGSSSVLSPFIRGIGQNDFAFNLEPGVGVYVDGVYYARTIGATVDLLDLDRVEVLKGPQGTLFGRNTIGGAINVVTRRPSEEFDYQGEVTLGSFDRLELRGALDVPILPERLYSQFAFSSKRSDGYQKRKTFPGSAGSVSDEDSFARAAFKSRTKSGGSHQDNFRGKLLWMAGDDVEVTLTADYSTVDEQGTPGTLVGTNTGLGPDGNPTIAAVYNICINSTPATLPPPLAAVCGPRAVGRTAGPGLNADGAPLLGVNTDADPTNDRLSFGDAFISDKDVSFATGSNFSKVDTSGVAMTLDWSLPGDLDFKSISAMRKLSAKFGIDLDGSPINIADTSFDTNQTQYSQELQLTGLAFESRLNWVVGLFYFHERGDLTDYVPFGEGLVQVFGENLFTNESFAGFVNMNYSLTERLGLTLGVRHTDEDKQFEGRQRDLNAFPNKLGVPAAAHPDPSDVTRIYPLGEQSKDFKDRSIRLGIEYQLQDETLLYASFSQGTKSGGFTTRLLVPEPNPNVAPDFDEETADSYEIGFKSRMFDDRLQLNMAAFYTIYDDIQVTVQRNISPTFENAGEGVIRGVEAEFESLITDTFRLSGGVGVLDAQYSSLEPGTVLDRGDRFVNTPNFSANLTANYTLPFVADYMALNGEFRVQASWNHKSNVANDAENNPLFFEDHINVVNAAVTYTSYASNWEATLGVRNLTDTRFVASGFENPGIGFSNAIFSRPREFYLSMRIWR